MPKHPLVQPNPWAHLRAFTDARIALGRAGNSQTTDAVLAFGVAHAQARDAVHLPLDSAAVAAALGEAGFTAVAAHSAAADRAEYLRRPDLGRRLDEASRARLSALRPAQPFDVVFVIADGLSALAVQSHAVPLLCSVRERLPAGRSIGPVAIAEQSRVALGDEIGALLGARQVVMLIGERPGLSSPDSLGIYLTYAPRVGRSDAERNCISNVRPAGLSYDQAASRLVFLLNGALALGRSGVDLKDDTPPVPAVASGTARLAERQSP
ncbi:ethanolamine ammonia-lyase subunit EutC [Ralstonia mannitolilytica]|uniref:ethanolamine ammonia-lyase subunit EutC n=1 Tax=Ralstonia mannitolilytica TaxID=105219 RepID=UPI000CEE1032|nr:ethanolamine ammonia-lyase subunit EutC [Ralstonia mannitolilytica]MBU9580888.1 ethanolamine ammonia-lyase subunit EutC [Ralstonia mannitolilytica]